MKRFIFMLFALSQLLSLQPLQASHVDPSILAYPALPSPNECTESYGNNYFKRANGYCQACNTVNLEYRKYYKICEFTGWEAPDEHELTRVRCTSDRTGPGAYKECEVDMPVVSLSIFKDLSKPGSSCVEDNTYGFSENIIWVTRGCGAIFEVCMEGDRCMEDDEEPGICVAHIPAGWIMYRVQAGDSLSSLARRTGTLTSILQSVNCIENPNVIFTGSLLFLPRWPDPVVIITPPTWPPVNPPDVIIVVPGEGGDRPDDEDDGQVPDDQWPEDPVDQPDEPGTGGMIHEDTIMVTCSSREDMEFCSAPGEILDVNLVSQLSSVPCTYGDTWGIDAPTFSIWTSGGCQALFNVKFRVTF